MRILDEAKLHEFSDVTLRFANEMITDDFVNWGGMIQGDRSDLACAMEMGYKHMFAFAQRFATKEELIADINKIKGKRLRDYAITKTIIIRSAIADESCFGLCDGVELNDNEYDPQWDFAIKGCKLDLKSTFLPTNVAKFGNFVGNWDAIKENPDELVRRMYKFQSAGSRCHREINPRFFLFNKSFFSEKNTYLLKAGCNARHKIIKEIVDSFTDDNILQVDDVYVEKWDRTYNGVNAAIALIYEDENHNISYDLVSKKKENEQA